MNSAPKENEKKETQPKMIKIGKYYLDVAVLLVSITLFFTGAILLISAVVKGNKVETVIYYKTAQNNSSYLESTQSEFEETQEQVITSMININTAGVDELTKLNGIGQSKAEAIIDYRTKNGPFKYIEELMKVSGIGEKTFEKLKEFITVE